MLSKTGKSLREVRYVITTRRYRTALEREEDGERGRLSSLGDGEWGGRVSLLREVQRVTKAAIACLLIPPLNA